MTWNASSQCDPAVFLFSSWVVFRYYSKKKKKMLQSKNGLGGSYIQFSMMDKSTGDKEHRSSTSTLSKN